MVVIAGVQYKPGFHPLVNLTTAMSETFLELDMKYCTNDIKKQTFQSPSFFTSLRVFCFWQHGSDTFMHGSRWQRLFPFFQAMTNVCWWAMTGVGLLSGCLPWNTHTWWTDSLYWMDPIQGCLQSLSRPAGSSLKCPGKSSNLMNYRSSDNNSYKPYSWMFSFAHASYNLKHSESVWR